jgi:excisionase family DNA binding protein
VPVEGCGGVCLPSDDTVDWGAERRRRTLSDDILTVEEAAAYAKIAPKTLRRWLKGGQLPGLRVGRHWRVEKRALLRFLREQGQQAVKGA